MNATSTGSGPGAVVGQPVPEPIRNWMDARLDFRQAVALRKSYIVASSFRSGSTFLCWQLWRTGVLGAPAEYFNVGAGRMWRDVMMRRLHVVSPEHYLAKLFACRTSRNGVFGVKIHFSHFAAALDWYPPLLDALSPVTFIYVYRNDAVAQAVSMAKAVQSGAWSSMDGDVKTALVYDEAFITRCLRDIQQQNLGWRRWFEENSIEPIIVRYEDLAADPPKVVGDIAELFQVENDEPEDISLLPDLEKQGDEMNIEWLARFRADRNRGTEPDAG